MHRILRAPLTSSTAVALTSSAALTATGGSSASSSSGPSSPSTAALSIPMRGFFSGTHPTLSARRNFQPFSQRDEEELVRVLTTKPKHVARHIRQSILQSSRHIAQFRNSVTYLMILLQSKLQKKEITPENAALVIQGIMSECIATRQSDMAHLLFRAAVRFRKYGVKLSNECVRILFDSYRGNQARELMETLANELRREKDMRAIVMTAYIFADQPEAALAVKAEIPREELTTEDFCAVIEGFGALGRHQEIEGIVKEAFEVQSQVNLPTIASSAVIATRGTPTIMNDLFQASINAGIPLSEEAIASVVRIRIFSAKTLAEVYETEKALREELGTDNFGLGAETAILARCSDLVMRQNLAADEVMLEKVKHLHAVVDASTDIEPRFLMSLLKGYGVMGKVEEMNKLFESLKLRTDIDSRLYDEVLRWNSEAENIKGVIHYKDEMEQRNIRHSAATYINVFKCLDKFYPRMVEKYYNEMIGKGYAVDGRMYPVLLRVFGEIGDMAMVEQLYAEMRAKSAQGLDVFTAHATRVLLNVFRADEARCEEIIAAATNRGLMSNDISKQALMKYYSRTGRTDEMLAVADSLSAPSGESCRIILRHYSVRNERPKFEDALAQMHAMDIPLDDETVRVLITAYSKWNDAAKVRNVLAEAAGMDGVHTAFFYCDAAAAFARVGDMEAMDNVWSDLVASKITITMSVFNRFLELYMGVNNLDKVQLILNHMLETVPPNPVTATTVVDMLGKMGRLNEMEALLDEMERSTNAAPTVVTYHQAMSAYAKVGDVAKVEGVRDRLRRANMAESAITYNILVEAHGRAKRFEHIAELIQERRSKGIPMEEFGYIGLINTYARARMIDEVNDVVASLLGSSVPLNARLLSVIAGAYSFIGDTPKVEHYVSLLLAHSTRRQRDVEAVFLMYSRMRDTKRLEEMLDRFPRTEYVYNICIGAFARSGDYVRVASLLQEMEQKKMTLQRNTSITLSSLLLKAGKVELAHAVLNWRTSAAGGGGGGGSAAEAARRTLAGGAEGETAAAAAAEEEEGAMLDGASLIEEQIAQQK